MRVGRTLQLARDMLRGNRFSLSTQKPVVNSLVRLSFYGSSERAAEAVTTLALASYLLKQGVIETDSSGR
jgi:hypothetical protein